MSGVSPAQISVHRILALQRNPRLRDQSHEKLAGLRRSTEPTSTLCASPPRRTVALIYLPRYPPPKHVRTSYTAELRYARARAYAQPEHNPTTSRNRQIGCALSRTFISAHQDDNDARGQAFRMAACGKNVLALTASPENLHDVWSEPCANFCTSNPCPPEKPAPAQPKS